MSDQSMSKLGAFSVSAGDVKDLFNEMSKVCSGNDKHMKKFLGMGLASIGVFFVSSGSYIVLSK